MNDNELKTHRVQNASFGAIFWSEGTSAVSLFWLGAWGARSLGLAPRPTLHAPSFFDILKITIPSHKGPKGSVAPFGPVGPLMYLYF